jgi:flagellar basal-body rod protein FlgC
MKVRYLSGMEISASGLAAQRRQMDVAAENLANLQTTRTETGDPYRRKVVRFQSQPLAFSQMVDLPDPPALARTDAMHLPGGGAVQATEDGASAGVAATVEGDPSEFPTVFDPGHPDADSDGMVRMPNVEMAQEMVSLLTASRAYEANIAALQAARTLADASLNLAR